MMSVCKMNKQIFPTFAFVVVCVQFTCQYTTANGLTSKVLITNDGPTILGATTTFTAKLSFVNETVKTLPSNKTAKGEPTYLYAYYWKQWICDEYKVVEIKQNASCNFTQTYTCSGDIGSHTVTVDVRKNTFIIKPLVTSNTTAFQISEHINANLSVKQGISCNSSYGAETCNVVATNKSVDMVVDIHDPSNFFKGATLLYHWRFGDGVADTTINQPAVSHMYKKPGHYGITVNMTAIFPNDAEGEKQRQPKTGNIKKNLHTMDAVRNLTIKGKGNFPAGVKESYNISCLASLPVEVCWYVIPITTHTLLTGYSDTIKCNQQVLTNRTWFEIHQWFNTSGGYSIGVRAQNTVSNANSNKNVHVEDSANTVVGLVIGVLFGVAGCILCAAVITSHMRGHRQRHVEVANFDFQSQAQRSLTLGTKIRQFFSGGSREESMPLSQDFNRNQTV
ncbi:transmembrane protein 130-like [Patiria miniata]|uniref:PKD domain-containing protein n=1 Tax=Patiria miniata TaxID=46514 RepID=A0A914AKH1_PATMI|nr:transmembrane protein 130-like [Patiria miniata]XP_038064226.1 transmembrane protein 130-like [Patiria miniata]XP_038064227.1 transmembrane protein 130-like [Patiria miniata]XP_038064228.1 transmembrane protein 130-like [Patiria miniata]